MSKINIELFGRESELVAFSQDGIKSLVIEFNEELDGYVALGKVTARIRGRGCAIDLRNLPDGEYTPHLILSDKTLDLPEVRLHCGIITPSEPEVAYTTRLSLRERRLRERVDMLEKRLDEITKRITGSSIFGTTP
ncbi:MAG: hypothetical protein IKW53_06360 [Clostridia bacterium]|nr:hypothetical protein [Clostridia bacterium]